MQQPFINDLKQTKQDMMLLCAPPVDFKNGDVRKMEII